MRLFTGWRPCLRIVQPKGSVRLCVFLCSVGLNAKDIHEEMFPVSDGKCLSLKPVHSWIEEHGKRFAGDEEIETEMRKWV
jgi:hypothetical protein